MATSPTRERHPAAAGWTRVSAAPAGTGSVWRSGPITVVSTLDQAELPNRSGIGPQWHVSITRKGTRPHATDVRRALRAFRMVGAEEDNHHPGAARHFWVVCDPAHRVSCECKEDEVTVTDPDGYRWQNPEDAAECRGCEWERMTGKPCRLHPGAAVVGGAR